MDTVTHTLAGPCTLARASLVAQESKESACSAGDLGSMPGSGRWPGEGNGNPLQQFSLGKFHYIYPGGGGENI